MSEDKDAEIARLRAANENNLAGWSNDRAGLSAKVARLEAEVAALRKERDEAIDRAGNAWALPPGKHPHPESCPTYYDGCHCTSDTLRHVIERSESYKARLSALAAAAREFRDAEREYGGGLRPELEIKAWRAEMALAALLSGEEGR